MSEAPDKTIALDRVGISKSLMTNPCERKGFYGETVRDAKGWRLRFPMPEKVAFGSAIDRVHADIVHAVTTGQPIEVPLYVAAAIADLGDQEWSEPIDWDRFRAELLTAIDLFRRHPDGFPRLYPDLPGIRIQGDNGRSLRAGDVIGTPDYLLADGSVLDVKSSHKTFYPSRFTESAEMPVYAYLSASEFGVIPPRLIYQVYVRLRDPKWQWMETPGTSALVALGKARALHWRKLLAAGDADLFQANTYSCGECGFREAIPEAGHAGCEVGALVVDRFPVVPQEAA